MSHVLCDTKIEHLNADSEQNPVDCSTSGRKAVVIRRNVPEIQSGAQIPGCDSSSWKRYRWISAVGFIISVQL